MVDSIFKLVISIVVYCTLLKLAIEVAFIFKDVILCERIFPQQHYLFLECYTKKTRGFD